LPSSRVASREALLPLRSSCGVEPGVHRHLDERVEADAVDSVVVGDQDSHAGMMTR
jgi:hypothetical protein